MALPIPGYRVGTHYGVPGRLWAAGHHTGEDWPAPVGTPIHSMTDGTVVHVGWGGWGSAYGAHVIVDDGHGHRHGYMHMSATLVRNGQRVQAGQQLGRVGLTGNTTGPHCHVESRVSPFMYGNRDINPSQFYGAGGGSNKTYLSKLKFGQRNSESVKNLQRALKKAFPRAPAAKRLPVTGYYGPATAFLVFKYKKQRMKQDPSKINRKEVRRNMARRLKLPNIQADI